MPPSDAPIVLALGAAGDFPDDLGGALSAVGSELVVHDGAVAPREVRPIVTLIACGDDLAGLPSRVATARRGAPVVVVGPLPPADVMVEVLRAGAVDFVPPHEGTYGLVLAVDRARGPVAASPRGPAQPPVPAPEWGSGGAPPRVQSSFSVEPSGDFTVTPPGGYSVSPASDGRSASTSQAGPTLERRPSSHLGGRPTSTSPSVPPGRPPAQPTPLAAARPAAAPPPPPPGRPPMPPGAEGVLAALAGRAGAGLLAKAQIAAPARPSGGVIVGAHGTAIPGASPAANKLDEALPPLDPGLPELQGLMARPECPVDDVERFVVKDPALVVAVLKVANSAYFRSPRLVTSIREACVRLGNRQVFALLLESLLRRTFTAPSPDARQFFDGMWRNAALTARVARRLAEWQRFARPEDVYVAALLHNLGEFVMAWRVVQAADGHLGSAIEAAAADIAKEHERVGQLAAQRWGLPPMVQVLAGSHHHVRRGEPSQDAAMRAAVTACWHLSRSVAGEYLPDMEAPDPLPLFDEMGLSEQLRARIAEECIAAMEGL